MTERISAIVSVFNGERYLQEALESVLSQTRPADEIIVVDDGSTDGSADIARAFDRVIVLSQANAGQARQGLAAIRAVNASQIQPANTVSQETEAVKIAEPAAPARSPTPPVVNTQGQLTGTFINTTA